MGGRAEVGLSGGVDADKGGRLRRTGRSSSLSGHRRRKVRVGLTLVEGQASGRSATPGKGRLASRWAARLEVEVCGVSRRARRYAAVAG